MSTRIGTLQAPGAGGPILLATFLVSLVMLTVAGGTLANTPTELSGGVRHKFVSDTLGTTTPTELSGGIIGAGLPAEFYDRHQRG